MTINIEQLKYPIGKYKVPAEITFEQISTWIDELAALPSKMYAAASGLSDEQLDTPYRPGGWTLRQVMHHVPDSHMNAYVRFKLAATEENPTIRPYDENLWSACDDSKSAAVDLSLKLLDLIHQRWVLFLRTLKYEDFERTYFHPEHNKKFILKNILGMYVWHGEHHLQHIISTRQSHSW